MQKIIFNSQNTQNRNLFTQTFGRECKPKIVQPKLSERNNFQLSKMQKMYKQYEPQSFRRQQQKKDVKAKEYSHNSIHKKQDSTRKNSERITDLDKIDEINYKICGLIKSISASCQKKNPLSIQKQVKYKQRSSKKLFQEFKTQQNNINYIDYLKTEKKKNGNPPNTQAKPSFFQQQPREQKRMLQQNLNFHQVDRKNQRSYWENDDRDSDMNQRLKRINDKINNYENKIKSRTSLEEYSHKLNYKVAVENTKQKMQNRVKNEENSKIEHKKQHKHSNDYQKSNKENHSVHPIQNNSKKNETLISSKSHELSSQRIGYFNKKYMDLDQVKSKKQEALQIIKFKLSQSKESYNQEKNFKQKEKSSTNNQNQTNNINNQLLSYKTTFLKQILRQISLDQDFRHAKHMFGGIEDLYDQDMQAIMSEKWKTLQRQLKSEGFRFDLAEIKEIFMPRNDEIDPFMSVSHSHEQLVHSLIFAYRACEKNWNESIYHNWTQWQLKEAKFTNQLLDKSKKGTITIEDLTSYINTQLDGSYRNRDLLLIYNRLKSGKGKNKQDHFGITYSEILDKLLSK